MSVSINSYLTSLSYKYFLNPNSVELEKINNSIQNLYQNLDRELGNKIKRKFVFGSYRRQTILPRKYDNKSDIDIMVIFNHTDFERTPSTYRNWLKAVSDKCYKDRYGSKVISTFPTITIRLNNINYDLVPAKEDTYQYTAKSIYIPDKDFEWQQTDPEDVKKKLTDANVRYKNIVKPIVRLLKAWNCNNYYPYDSYKLELDIVDMNFQGDTVETGFEYAVRQLEAGFFDPQSKKDKIQSLKYNVQKVRECLNNNERDSAIRWLHRVLPI